MYLIYRAVYFLLYSIYIFLYPISFVYLYLEICKCKHMKYEIRVFVKEDFFYQIILILSLLSIQLIDKKID